MGVDFQAVLGHQFETVTAKHLFAEVERFAFSSQTELVNAIFSIVQKPDIIPEMKKQQEHTSWKMRFYSRTSTIEKDCSMRLYCPGVEVIWGLRAFIVSDGEASWISFLTDETVRARLRKICYEFARSFGSLKTIYLPDSGSKIGGALDLVYEGKSIDDVEEWLLQQIGPSSPAIETICKSSKMVIEGKEIDVCDAEGYYVDTFRDFPAV